MKEGTRVMKILRRAIPFMVAFLFASALLPGEVEGSPDSWTFMVYMGADNELEWYAINNFLQMSEVASSSYVNITVQLDRITGHDSSYNDWTGCLRFEVTQGMVPTPASASQNIGEVDMGDPAELVSFVNWASAAHPADHYVLIIWGHGGDWLGACSDETSTNDILELDELYSALSTITLNFGAPLDILGFDACSMGSVEVGYQLRQFADYFLASEGSTPSLGFCYDRPLWALVNQTTMTPLAFCDQILAGYHDYYYSMIGKPYMTQFAQSLTLSAIDTGYMEDVASAADNLSSELRYNMVYWVNHVKLARNATETYDGPYAVDADIIDLLQFADNLRSMIFNDTIDALCTDLIDAITACVKGEMHLNDPLDFSRPVDNAHGLSVYFPENATDYNAAYPSAPQSNYTADTGWEEFLSAYYAEKVKGNPTVMQILPIGTNVDLDASISIAFSEPMDTTSLTDAFTICPDATGSLQWNSTDNSLSFAPTDRLIPSTCYFVTINSSAMDMAGKHLPYNCTWNFTTRAIAPDFATILNLTGELGENGWYISQVNATLSTTDPEGTNWTRYQLNSCGWQTFSTMLAISTEGNYTLEYCSQDLSGVTHASENATLGIDLNPPSSSAVVSGSWVVITASDNVSGVNRTMYRIDGGTWQEYTWALDVTGSGNHTVEYYSVDEAGYVEPTRATWVDNGMNAFEIISSYGLYIVIAIILIIVAIAVLNYASKGKGREGAD